MISNSMNPATIAGTSATHCVFRTGSRWLALPATVIREVAPCPDIVQMPGTPEAFAGLCHVRSEFIPVLNLATFVSEPVSARTGAMLILEDKDSAWAMLVDEVLSLSPLETSDAPESQIAAEGTVIVGWATLNDNVVHILDQSRIRSAAEHQLHELWEAISSSTSGATLT